MRNHYLRYLLFLICTLVYNCVIGQTSNLSPISLTDYKVQMEKDVLIFNAPGSNGTTSMTISGNDDLVSLNFVNGKATLPYPVTQRGKLLLLTHKNAAGKNQYKMVHVAKKSNGSHRVRNIPMWLSVVPPLIAILLALLFKEVVVSLFIGIWAGAFIAGGLRIESLYYFLISIFEVVEKYVVKALADSSHISIIVFSLMIGGMVAIISRNGGMAGVVKSLSRYAKDAKSTQFITWVLGVAIFFDDYANTLIVGNTMRSVTDKFKISREKLAYIVDSTAAPVSAVAFITTWIGAELSYIADATATLQGFDTGMTPYALFVSSLRYSFYPILTLIFILILIFTRRDYGPMWKAENRARTTGQVSSARNDDEDEPDMEDLSPVKGAPLKWYNAAIPVLVVILLTIFGLIDTGIASVYGELVGKGINPASEAWGDVWPLMYQLSGEDASFFMRVGKLIGSSDSYVALLWASFGGLLVAILMTVGQKIMKLIDTMHNMTIGFKTMLPALIILTLAWSLAITTEELHTATYITNLLQDSLSPYLMPAIIFILAAFIAFSTGSSWSTMAILYPIAIPTTWAICQTQGIAPDISMEILLNVIATVLAASVVGDHCSPISDTTILSSLASDCNHIDHVRTQLPYALTVGITSLIAGSLATFFGGGILICLLLMLVSVGILFGIVRKFGKPSEG